MILYNYRIYGVLKEPSGEAIKGKQLFIYSVVCGSTKGNGEHGNCLLANLKNSSRYAGRPSEQEETRDYTQG